MRALQRLVGLAGLVLAAGCGQTVDGPVGRVSSRLEIPDTGFIPYPVKPPEVGEPAEPSWDGSVVELMAADAYAQCGANARRLVWTWGRMADEYLADLETKMEEAKCYEAGVGVPVVYEYLTSRVDHPECNVDPVSGAPSALPPLEVEDDAYVLPTLQDLGLASYVPDDLEGALKDEAQSELDVAEVNLCMAQRLREHLATADGLFTSSEAQLDLLNVIRERSQIAMIQFALLGEAFASTYDYHGFINHELMFLPVLRAWSDWAPADFKATLGADFAAAIKLHVETVQELGQMLLRAEYPVDEGRSLVTRTWGPNSGRDRLLRLLYGGDPQADVESTDLELEDARDAHVEVLYGLARQADAFYFRVAGPDGNEKLPLVLDETVESIYKRVEAKLRADACEGATPGDPACDITWESEEIPDVSAFDEYQVWQRFGVMPEHAASLAKKIYQALPAVQPGASNPSFGRWHFTGEHDASFVDTGPDDVAGWIHLDPAHGLSPLAIGVREKTLLSVWRLNMPGPEQPIQPWQNPREQGFVARLPKSVFNLAGFKAESMRWAGATTALAAVRNSIYSGMKGHADADGYYVPASAALPVIATAIGPSVSLLPQRSPAPNGTSTSACVMWSNPDPPSSCPRMMAGSIANPVLWQTVSVVAASQSEAVPVAGGYARGQVEAVLDPEHVDFLGATRAELLDSLTPCPLQGVDTLTDGLERRRYTNSTDRIANPRYAVFLKDTLTEGAAYGSVLPYTQRVFQSVPDDLIVSFDGQHLGFGGYLTGLAQRAWAVHPQYWAVPRYDAFGLPTDWIPPSQPGVMGAVQPESAVEYYLSRARTAAAEATGAAQQTIDRLMTDAEHEADLEASRERGAQVDLLEQRAFCGDQIPDCEVLGWPLQIDAWACDYIDDLAIRKWCIDYEVDETFVFRSHRTPTVAKQIADIIDGDSTWFLDTSMNHKPTFSEYTGGQLQGLLVRQWQAVEAYVKAMGEFGVFFGESVGTLMAADDVLADFESSVKYYCHKDTFLTAFRQGFTVGSIYDFMYFPSYDYDTMKLVYAPQQYADSTSYNPGPFQSAVDHCKQAEFALEQAGASVEAQAVATVSSLHVQLVDRSIGLTQRMNEIVQSQVALNEAYQKYKLTRERNQLDIDLAEQSAETKFGIRRRFHSFDVWRTRALLENARRLAVAARRAIEARFVVDLSRLTAPEPFVQAPALWADDVYAPDLHLPSALGLTVRPELDGAGTGVVNRLDSVYINQVEDYVNNLQLFVDGYSVWRPTAVATGDAEVLSFDGPEQTEEVTIECEEQQGSGCTDSGSCLHVQSWAASDPASQQDSTIRPELLLVNNGTTGIPLSELTIRYWFTVDTTSSVVLSAPCDWSSIDCANITRSFATVDPAVTGADRYLELGFSSAAGTLAVGGTAEMKLRIHEQNYALNFNELNDFSYDPRSSYAPTTVVSVYRNGELVWGTEPIESGGEPCEDQVAARLTTEAGLWSYYCEQTDEWTVHPGLGELPVTSLLETACDGGPPRLARLTFSLDPWGRVFGDVFEPPLDVRHNVRWRRLAVNLVGTGIRDCEQAADPLECYNEGFARYDLSHTGRVWITDYEQAWRMLGLPITTIESGKALAVEEWVDPVAHGWAMPMVQAVSRGELQSRPLGGDYSITFEITPDMRLDRIERVQILTESDYWVRQEY